MLLIELVEYSITLDPMLIELIPDSQEEERWVASIKVADVGALTRRDVLQSNTEHIKATPTGHLHE